MVVCGSRRWRVPAYEIEEMVRELLGRDIRYGAAREALPQRIAHAVLVRMEQAGEAPDDRVQNAVARNAAVKAVVKECWPPVDPAKLVLRLLGDAAFWPSTPRGAHGGRAEAAPLGEAGPEREVGEVVGGGRGARGRGDGPGGADALARARGPRRGAGPVPHAVPGGGPPLHDRFGHRPGRPGAGDDAVGDGELGAGARAPGEAGGGGRGADGRLPRAARGHRVRLAAAAAHVAGARGGGVGPGEPGVAGGPARPCGGPGRGRGRGLRRGAGARGLDRSDRRRRADRAARGGAGGGGPAAPLAGRGDDGRVPPDPGPGVAREGPGVRLRGPGRAGGGRRRRTRRTDEPAAPVRGADASGVGPDGRSLRFRAGAVGAV